MAIENKGSTERINEMYRYVLRLYGRLINGQKALVTLIDIQVFFDILVLDEETPDKCEEKSYLRIYTNGTGERKKAIQDIQENNFETASDDLYSFHHKTQLQELGEFAEVLDLNNNSISSQHTRMDVRANDGKVRNKGRNSKAPEKGEEDLEDKEYMSSLIKIKIMCLKKRFSHSEVKKEGSLKFFLQKFGLDNKADMPYDKITRVPEDIEKEKYPDAYVFPPKKGIMTERPVTGLNFVSLYPSIIMTYNLSSEKIILDREKADNVCKNKNELYTIEFKFNKYDIQAWCVRHENQFERKELYPAVLEDLSIKRLELKERLRQRIPESLNLEYSSICFDYDYWIRSKALKVYMNTFYGKAGNSLSPIFLRELACETTIAGKYNLNLVVKFVSKKGFGIKYGDTDSLCLTCPDRYYEKCNEAFSGKNFPKKRTGLKWLKLLWM
ncbi:9237_t:CDS:2 [Funneliformis geosporum]|uniref:DNA-directed DNA polymerase n=1 Tax=Funneliformis geosporum TaxID=1117311 RepID=A0A9W4WPF7_9GLOM|nr:9237_t:CDS:2 [Funneliformis geosporum]